MPFQNHIYEVTGKILRVLVAFIREPCKDAPEWPLSATPLAE